MGARKRKESGTISFEYKRSKFYLKIDSYDITCSADFDYRRECGSDNDECEHEMNRCMVLSEISFKKFNKHSFVKNGLSLVDGDPDLTKEAIEIVCRAFSGISFEDYLEANAVPDYYGETLKIEVSNLTELKERMTINLGIEGCESVQIS